MMTRTRCFVTLACVLLALSACAQLGLSTPQSFDERLAQAYGAHTAVISATTTALTTGSISSTDAEHVQTIATTSRTLLDTAKAAETAGDTAGAQKNLVLAMSALQALQTYLNTHGSAK